LPRSHSHRLMQRPPLRVEPAGDNIVRTDRVPTASKPSPNEGPTDPHKVYNFMTAPLEEGDEAVVEVSVEAAVVHLRDPEAVAEATAVPGAHLEEEAEEEEGVEGAAEEGGVEEEEGGAKRRSP